MFWATYTGLLIPFVILLLQVKLSLICCRNGDRGTFISAVYLTFQFGTSCRFGHDEGGTMYCSKMSSDFVQWSKIWESVKSGKLVLVGI